MNKFVRYSMLAVYVGAGVSAVAKADPQTQMDKRDPTFNAGPVAVTLGGFTALEGIYRAHNENADVGSSFYKIPFPGAAQNFQNTPGATSGANSQQYYEPEFRMSARQSRFGLLAQYGDSENKLEYYMETDFLSAGTTSNSNESNSYTLRMRHFYGDWQTADWSILAGQTWSLATPFSHGLDIRKQFTPLTIDAQYVVGFNWARQAQLRIVRKLGVFGALGLSIEEPQVGTSLGSAPTGVTSVGNTAGNGSGLLNPSTTYSDDIAPDIIVKYAVDPGFGHYEVYSLTRFFHNRSSASATDPMKNRTNVGESVGASFVLPLMPKVIDFQASGLFGRGNGRYGSGQMGDITVNPGNGSLTPTTEVQFLVGVVAHPTPRLDTYVYAGMEKEKAQFGDGGASNAGCETNPGLSTSNVAGCTLNMGSERQVAFGLWWKAYKGAIGSAQFGLQGSYLTNHTLTAADGTVGRANEPMGFVSVRFYPFQ